MIFFGFSAAFSLAFSAFAPLSQHSLLASFLALSQQLPPVLAPAWQHPDSVLPLSQHAAPPVSPATAAATGAYIGSLAGAMHGLEDKKGAPQRRPSGVILSVRIADPANKSKVIDVLRAKGAADIEQAQGEWRDGDWVDFDPVAVPRLVQGELR